MNLNLDTLRRLDEKRTPGQWQALINGSWGCSSAVATADGHPIAFVGEVGTMGSVEADVRLMAFAPDLLAEVIRLTEIVEAAR